MIEALLIEHPDRTLDLDSRGGVHLAVFSDHTWLFIFCICMVSAWENAMEAIATRRGRCHGSHGKKEPMAEKCLDKISWRPCQKTAMAL